MLAPMLLLGSAAGASTSATVDAAATGPGSPSAQPGLDGGHPLFLTPPPATRPTAFTTTNDLGPTPPSVTQTFGIPTTVLDAYRHAADLVGRSQPACHLPWQVLAGIGKVESGHAEGGYVDQTGRALQPILGPALDGSTGFAAIPNTVGARWDQSGIWAQAVGPMQFLPSSWARWGADGNADGVADPENVYDAALTAGDYLCADGRNLATPDGLRDAILSYNHSDQYLAIVAQWIEVYSQGVLAVPDSLVPIGETGMQQAGAASPAGSAAPPPAPPPPPSSSQPAPPPQGSGGSSGTPPPPAPPPPPAQAPAPVGGLLPAPLRNHPAPAPAPVPAPVPTHSAPPLPPLCSVQAVLGCRAG